MRAERWPQAMAYLRCCQYTNYQLTILGVKYTQSAEGDWPSRRWCEPNAVLKQWPTWAATNILTSVDYIGSKGTGEYAISGSYVNVGHTAENCMATVSIVNGNVWVNMWATAYALPMWRRTHGGCSWVLARRVQSWIFIYIYMLYIFCRYTNRDFVKIRTVRIRLDIYRERRNFVLCYRR